VVEGAALEMLCRATYRGFESHLLRHFPDRAVKIIDNFNGSIRIKPCCQFQGIEVRRLRHAEIATPPNIDFSHRIDRLKSVPKSIACSQ
jgi:hypothetical protein